MQIEHNSNEPKIDRTPMPWKIVVPVMALVWAADLYFLNIDLVSVCLGGLTGYFVGVFAVQASA